MNKKVTVSLGLHFMGKGREPRASIRPSEANTRLALVSDTSKVEKGVTSKSRLAMDVGRGVLRFIRVYRTLAETAGLIGKGLKR